MGLLFLDEAGIASVSDEDHECCEAFRWLLRQPGPKNKPMLKAHLIVPGIKSRKRKRYIWLHRLVALRMRPDLEHLSFFVTPKNGDYMDCRRENLEITVHARKPRRKPRPVPEQSRLPNDAVLLAQRPNWRRKSRKTAARRGARQAHDLHGDNGGALGGDFNQ